MKEELVAQTWARGIKKLKGLDVFENTRRRDVVTYRSLHVVMCRKNLNWSLERIGRFYKSNGKKSYDHATVLHSERMFEQYCFYDDDLMTTMSALSGMVDDSRAKLQNLQAKLKYIDSEFYDAIEGCMQDAYNMTVLKNQEQIQKEKEQRYAEIYGY